MEYKSRIAYSRIVNLVEAIITADGLTFKDVDHLISNRI